jgi:hypothetical protein
MKPARKKIIGNKGGKKTKEKRSRTDFTASEIMIKSSDLIGPTSFRKGECAG